MPFDSADYRRVDLARKVVIMTWLTQNWLAVLVIGLGVMSVFMAFVVYAVTWIAGRDDHLLDKTKKLRSDSL